MESDVRMQGVLYIYSEYLHTDGRVQEEASSLGSRLANSAVDTQDVLAGAKPSRQ